MKLAVLTNIPNPYNRDLFDALRRRGEDLRVVYSAWPADEGRAWVVPLGPGEVVGATPGELAPKLRSAVGWADVVVCSGSYVGLAGLLRRAAVGRSTDWYYWGERLRGRAPRAYPRRYFGGSEGVLAVGTTARASYARARVPGRAIHVLPYTTAVPAEPGSRADDPVVGFAGTITERKGLDLLIEALALVEPGARPRLEVAGDGPLRPELGRRAVQRSVDLRWLGDLQPGELADRAGRWWVQVVPSRYDGWGVVVNEALAAGRPVISSARVGAGCDMVRDGEDGYVFDTVPELARAITRSIEPEALARLSDGARRVGEAFSVEHSSRFLVEVLAAGPGGPARDFTAEAWARVERGAEPA